MRIRPPEKSLCFSTSFECTFEPSIIIFRAPSSTHFLSSAPLSLWPSKVVHFLTLPPFSRALSSPYLLSSAPSSLWSSFFRALSSPYLLSSPPSSLISFKCAFEPLIIIFRALSSPYLLSSAPLSPRFPFERAFEPSFAFERAFEPSLTFRARLWAITSFERAFEPSPSFRACLWALVFFSSAPSSPRPFVWVHFRALIFLSFFFYLGRLPITLRPFLCIFPLG